MRALSLRLILVLACIVCAGCPECDNQLSPSGVGSGPGIKHYGYWFIGDASYIHEVAPFTNLVQIGLDLDRNMINGRDVPRLNWSPALANAIIGANLDVMLQLPFVSEELLTQESSRRAFLYDVRQNLESSGLLSRIKYLEISEEWYSALIPQGHLENWEILRDKNQIEKYEIIKSFLEETISETKRVFPGIPVAIPEISVSGFPAALPSNLDVLAIDAYFTATSPNCDTAQKNRFDNSVTRIYNMARAYNKPVIMIGQSFTDRSTHPIPSRCQMEWFYKIANDPAYNIETLVWFLYPTTHGAIGAREYPELVAYHRRIGCEILRRGC